MSRSLMLELHLGIFNTQGNVKHMEIVQKLLSCVTQSHVIGGQRVLNGKNNIDLDVNTIL